jgi:hypothetical protein
LKLKRPETNTRTSVATLINVEIACMAILGAFQGAQQHNYTEKIWLAMTLTTVNLWLAMTLSIQNLWLTMRFSTENLWLTMTLSTENLRRPKFENPTSTSIDNARGHRGTTALMAKHRRRPFTVLRPVTGELHLAFGPGTIIQPS